jgi:vacuolar-type H+-ATPase subunit H
MGADLGRLLEAEQSFAARVDAARRDGRALVAAAQAEAETLACDSTSQLSDAKKALADAEDRTLAAELARIDAETTARVERLGAVDDAWVAALAERMLRTLLSGARS